MARSRKMMGVAASSFAGMRPSNGGVPAATGMNGGNGPWGPPDQAPPDKAKALERLATARANLAGLERRAAPPVEPALRSAVEQRQRQIEQLDQQIRSHKRGRATRQARQQLEALGGTQRLVIECLGYRSYEEFRHATARADATRVDDRIIDAARQEVDRAERHFFDTAEMAIPVPAPAPAPMPAPMPFSAMSRPRLPMPAPAPAASGRRRPVAPPARWAAG
jgi:hypothetical protein